MGVGSVHDSSTLKLCPSQHFYPAPAWGGCREIAPSAQSLHALQGNLCFSTWTTLPPSFFSSLGACRVVSLTFCCLLLSVVFSPLSYIHFPQVSPQWLGGSAMRCGGWLEPLEPAVSKTGKLQLLLTETPCSHPPAPQTNVLLNNEV